MSEQCTEHMPDAYATSNALSICTDVTERNGLTEKVSHLPEITPSSVTRTRIYGFSSDDSQDQPTTPRPGWWTCHLCQPPVHDRGGQAAFYAHYNRVHGSEVER